MSFFVTDEFSVGSQQLVQGSVSHKRIAYLSDFDLFITQ